MAARYIRVGGCTAKIVVRRGKVTLLLSNFWSRKKIDAILGRK